MSESLELFKDLPKSVKASGGRPNPNNPDDPNDPAVPVETPEPGEEDPYEDDEENIEEEDPNPPAASAAAARMNEIEMLKQRALLMGIKFSNNIGIDSLRAKIQAKRDGETLKADTSAAQDREKQHAEQLPPVKNDRQLMYEQEMRLVRLRITNLDPKKKDLPGEIFTVANKVLGAVKKYIPYGEATDNGYHVPYVIYRQLKEREFLNIKTRKDRQGRTIVESSMAREFALEELPQLNQKELDRLAASQAAASGMSN